MARIHVAVEAVGIKHSGGSVVLLDFLEAACSSTEIEKISVFCSPREARNFDLPSSEKVTEIPQIRAEHSVVARFVWYEHWLQRALISSGAHVSISMGSFGRGHPSIPHATFIQQSLPFSREALNTYDWKRRLYIKMLGLAIKRSARSASTIIVQTPEMFRSASSAFSLDPQKIVCVIPCVRELPPAVLPSAHVESMRRTKALHKILYVGTSAPYKNIGLLVSGMKLLCMGESQVELFMTVPPCSIFDSTPNVSCLGYLKGSELTEAYRLADALVLPSFTETVGLPLMEAMSVGTPVLAADRPYSHAICEDAALFFDPWSPEDFAEKVLLIIQDSHLRNRIIQQGFDLIEKRRKEKPYQRMVDTIVDLAKPRLSS